MKKFAMFTESDYESREFKGFLHAEAQEEADDKAWDYVDCNCELYEDYDEEDEEDGGIEPECTCNAHAEQVSMDTIHYDELEEKFYTRKELDQRELDYLSIRIARSNKDITKFRSEIKLANARIKELHRRSKSDTAELARLSTKFAKTWRGKDA